MLSIPDKKKTAAGCGYIGRQCADTESASAAAVVSDNWLCLSVRIVAFHFGQYPTAVQPV
jgi:hypothetical protein